jgi:[acyl-carrier-protein] S-malonyltransferase
MWAFFFPGQGSQSPGMGKWLYDEFSIAKRVYEEASDALKLDLKKICFDGPEDELQKTENTQPAILATSIAYFRSVRALVDITPRTSAGHSIGEYAALVAAEALPFEQAMIAVRERGLAMQAAVPLGKGGMCAVLNLEDAEVKAFCEWATKESGLGIIEAANFNTPGQVVISGIQSTLEWSQKNWGLYQGPGAGKKARFIPLKVSAPFHCSLMKPAEEHMAVILGTMPFQTAKWPIIQNFSAEETTGPDTLKQNLIKQVSGTVRWTESIQRTQAIGITKGLELGQGQVIRGLNKKINSELEMAPLQSLDDLKNLEKLIKGTK